MCYNLYKTHGFCRGSGAAWQRKTLHLRRGPPYVGSYGSGWIVAMGFEVLLNSYNSVLSGIFRGFSSLTKKHGWIMG